MNESTHACSDTVHNPDIIMTFKNPMKFGSISFMNYANSYHMFGPLNYTLYSSQDGIVWDFEGTVTNKQTTNKYVATIQCTKETVARRWKVVCEAYKVGSTEECAIIKIDITASTFVGVYLADRLWASPTSQRYYIKAWNNQD